MVEGVTDLSRALSVKALIPFMRVLPDLANSQRPYFLIPSHRLRTSTYDAEGTDIETIPTPTRRLQQWSQCEAIKV